VFEVFERERTEWDKLDDEKASHYAKFEIYRLLGPTRTLLGAYREALSREIIGPISDKVSVPGSWKGLFVQFNWRERAEKFDEADRKQAETIRAVQRERILNEGYALMHERVKKLGEIAEKLEAYIGDENRVWLPDVKQIGRGDEAERVDLVRFNASLFHEYRESLGDIAEELGHRVKKTELSGPEGKPIPMSITDAIKKFYGDSDTK
jgi:hypothetical protein